MVELNPTAPSAIVAGGVGVSVWLLALGDIPASLDAQGIAPDDDPETRAATRQDPQ
jgi:hypothetical protein